MKKLITLSTEDNIFLSQPFRDNTFYLLQLVDETLISEMDHSLPFAFGSSKLQPRLQELESSMDFTSALLDALQGESAENLPETQKPHDINEDEKASEEWWDIYDNLWIIISEMNGKGQNKTLPRSSSFTVPSLSQRARGLVESLNIPAAEMAAAVSGGISSALVGKSNKAVDKAMLLRGERCSRVASRLMILYLCRSSLERASRCVQQIIPVLPYLLATDDEQSKSRLSLFIWSLLAVKSKYGKLDDGVRFHVISSLIRETVNSGTSMLATNITGSEYLSDLISNSKEESSFFSFIQKDRVLGAVADEVKYIQCVATDRILQLDELQTRMEEDRITDSDQKKAFEEQIKSNINTILASDDSRRSTFQLSSDEDQQMAEKWIHTLRLLFDERGPWSSNPFLNSTIAHWKLDKTEDSWRRRQKLRRNYHFNENLCYPSIIPNDGPSLPSSGNNKFSFGSLTPENMKQLSLKGIRSITDDGPSGPIHNEAESSRQKITEIDDPSPIDGNGRENAKDRKDSPSVTESENGKVLMSILCVLVTLKRKLAGRLTITKEFLHFFGDFLVEGTGGSSVLKTYYCQGSIDPTKPETLSARQKLKLPKWPTRLPMGTERLSLRESINSIHGDGKRHISIKRHRWWNISMAIKLH